jgi:hypothetical protein
MRLNLLQTPHNGVVVCPNLWETHVTDHALGCVVDALLAVLFCALYTTRFTKTTYGLFTKAALDRTTQTSVLDAFRAPPNTIVTDRRFAALTFASGKFVI